MHIRLEDNSKNAVKYKRYIYTEGNKIEAIVFTKDMEQSVQ